MGKLIFTGIVSLDGYINDSDGNFDWAEPDEQLHWFFNELDRAIGIHLYGRKLYETLLAWETMPLDGEPEVIVDYAGVWRAAEKIVFSSTLPDVSSANTTLQREISPGFIDQLKRSSPADIGIGGPTLAAQVFDQIDEIQLIVNPVIVGGGTPFFPRQKRRMHLLESRVFPGGVVYLRYEVQH